MDYLIYCDESCHLERDRVNFMVLGAMKSTSDDKLKVVSDIRRIKENHGLSSHFEIKWTKVSNKKMSFYHDLTDYFFSSNLSFRAVVATGKDQLDNDKYNSGSYDLWYYKMYYLLLDHFCEIDHKYRIFIDIKDTLGNPRVEKLHKVLCNNKYDYFNEIVQDIQRISSFESEILQLTDLLIGAISYNRRFDVSEKNTGKAMLIDYITSKYNVNLSTSTRLSESKFNLFIWEPRRENF